MTRTLGAGLTTAIAATTGERCQLILLDFADLSNNPTPVYLTTAAKDISWNGFTWQAVGGLMDLDALGEDPSGGNGQRLKLSGVNQVLLALILGSRWRGRNTTIYHTAVSPQTGLVVTDPVVMFKGPMNGGFSVGESRGDFGGGTIDVTARLTSRLDELVKVRGIRCNLASHQSTVAGASADTFFSFVDNLVLRKTFWGMKTPSTTPSAAPQPGTGPGGLPGGGTPGSPNPNTGGNPYGGVPNAPKPPAPIPPPPPSHGNVPGMWNV